MVAFTLTFSSLSSLTLLSSPEKKKHLVKIKRATGFTFKPVHEKGLTFLDFKLLSGYINDGVHLKIFGSAKIGIFISKKKKISFFGGESGPTLILRLRSE